MKIIGIDPGKTTGWCSLELNDLTKIKAGQCESILDLYDLLGDVAPDVVICEAFRLYPWKARQQSWDNIPSAEVIGALRLYCNQHQLGLIEQAASVRKGIQDAWLHNLGFWKITRGKDHARDAARHLLYYCLQEYPSSFVPLLAKG